MAYYKHLKTNKIYIKVSTALNEDTNSRCVIYTLDGKFYVRDERYFDTSFIKCNKIGFEPQGAAHETLSVLLDHIDGLSIRASTVLINGLMGSLNLTRKQVFDMPLMKFRDDFYEHEILKFKNCGNRTIKEIRGAFEERGIPLLKDKYSYGETN